MQHTAVEKQAFVQAGIHEMYILDLPYVGLGTSCVDLMQ